MFRTAVFVLAPVVLWGGDWNPKSAAGYLDQRAAQWAAWKRAAREGGPCISCHTSLGYLLARPELRAKLGESSPTQFETGLLAGARTRAGSSMQKNIDPAKDNTPVVITALALALDDERRDAGLSPETESALKLMWAAQRRDGKEAGAWSWTDAQLEPWEVAESPFFGAALAAVAVGLAPAGYAARVDVRSNVTAMKEYLRNNRERQPLANRLALLWASARMPDLVSDAERRSIVEDTWKAQSGDGGWTLASLGPWRHREGAPEITGGSNAYATAWAVAMLERAGVVAGMGKDKRIARGQDWLRAHQDPDGYWDALSMNKTYEPGSMEELFMRDAATAWAVMALTYR